MSPARVAVSAHGRVASVTDTWSPATEQPVDSPTLKLYAPALPPVAVAVAGVPKVTLLGAVTVTVACVALCSATGKLALADDTSWLMSPARVAVSAHGRVASVTDTWSPATEQPVDSPTLKLYAPALPPVAVAVAGVPKVTLLGAVTVTVACVALCSATGKLALADDTSWLMSPARVAVSAHGRVASVTDTWSPATEQPVDSPTLKLYAPALPPVAVAVAGVPKVTLLGAVTVTVACVALCSATGKLALADDTSWLMSPARVAVSAHGRVASVTDTWSPATEQPVDSPTLKLYAPALPPVAVAVAGVPKVTLLGAVTVTVACVPALTVNTKLCDAFGVMPFAAVSESGNVPAPPGVPASVAVPLPLSVKVTPPGKVPVLLRLGVGVPVANTVKEPGAPTLNVAVLALVIAGAVPAGVV